QFTNRPVTPVISVVDITPVSVAATLDGQAFVSGTPISGPEGAHTLAITATDAAGNSSSSQIRFTFDFTPPVITITGVTDGQYSRQPVTPASTITDDQPNPRTTAN